MLEYMVRLFVLVPLVGGLAWGSLWLWKRLQASLPHSAGQEASLRITAALSMGTSGKLVVVEFANQELLVSVSRNGIALIAKTDGAAVRE